MNDVFDRLQKRVIPFFQRSYVWDKENWERLFDDINLVSMEGEPYFMGVVVLKQISTTSNDYAQRIVIDGQQRLTTLNLFFRAACEIQDNLDFYNQAFVTLKNDEPLINHNHTDKEIFEGIVTGNLTDELVEKYKSNLVLKCYQWFWERSSEISKMDLIKIYSNLFFVGIDLDGSDDEQKIFDTINSLGVTLTTAELLKNELYQEPDLPLYEKTWKPIFEPANDISAIEYWNSNISSGRNFRTAIDLFLQTFIILRNDKIDSTFRVEDLFDNYRKWLRNLNVANQVENKEEFCTALANSGQIFRDNFLIDIKERIIDGKNYRDRLVLLTFAQNITTFIPYIQYILENVSDLNEQQKMFSIIEAYLVRRIVCGYSSKSYNLLFAGFVKQKVNSSDSLLERLLKVENNTDQFPDDSEFETAIHEYWQYNNSARTVLYLLEKSLENENSSGTLLPINSYHLEHLMPKKWRNHWGKLDENQSQLRDDKLLTFGNLSLLRSKLNIAIRDSNWDKKKSGNDNNGLNTYAKGLQTLSQFLDEPEWNEEAINNRADWIFKKAKLIWPKGIN